MSIIEWPLDLPVRSQDFGVDHFDLDFTNDDTGSGQTAVLGPRRMTCAMTSEDAVSIERAARWRSLIFALAGRVNQVAIWDVLHPTPRGTVRGLLTAAQPAAAGATTLYIQAGPAQAGRTLLQGDWIGVHQASADVSRQLLHVQANAVVDGQGLMAVQIGVPLRVALPASSPVAWDRPTCLMRQTTTNNKWTSRSAGQSGFSMDLRERWE